MIDYDILNKTKNQEFTVILKGHGLKKEKKKKKKGGKQCFFRVPANESRQTEKNHLFLTLTAIMDSGKDDQMIPG